MHARASHLLVALGCVLWLAFGTAASAQTTDPAPEATAPSDQIDFVAWDADAARAEGLVLRAVASQFALTRLRDSLVVWRDVFSGKLDQNEQRLTTLAAQIAALGEAPADGASEPQALATRRNALENLQEELAAPGILVNEAYARADGLIRETDRLIRTRQTEGFLVRSASPLNPAYWGEAATALLTGITDLGQETAVAIRADLASGAMLRKLPMALLYFAIAYFLILRSRSWMAQQRVKEAAISENTLTSFALGFGQIAAPLIGLIALTLAINTMDLPGLRSGAVLGAVPIAGVLIIVGHWLAAQFFPPPPMFGPMGYQDDTRRRARRVATALAWGTGLWQPYEALLDSDSLSAEVNAVLILPVMMILGILLFRLGQLLRHQPAEHLPDNVFKQGSLRRITGQFCSAVAIAAPVLTAVGYAAAAEALILPTILSLAVLAIVVYLQKLVNDVYAIWAQASGRQSETLVPVLLGFGLLAIALPILALIWGARVSELLEIWTRFREGFTIGETRLSPTDFMTFVLIFAIGYMLTRVIQRTLKQSVLPRTRLDLGGQNAVVAGFGYVGIGLAAIVAVTSAGIDLSSLAIVAGALSVGIGFGLQNIVSNFVSGIILLIERPVSEGDWIEVGGQMGYVRDISVRSTRIETFDRTDVIVPNADLVSNQVTNWTRGNLVGRVIVPVGVAYGSDIKKVKTILTEIAENHPMVLMTPPPAVMFRTFGASSLDFEIRAILRDVNFVVVTQSEMNFEIAARFAAEGIEIPFPQQDIWLRNPETLSQTTDKGDI